MERILKIHGVSLEYRSDSWFFSWRKSRKKALDTVDLYLKAGESLGIVGESGSGKSSLLRVLLGLESPTSGEIFLFGESLKEISASRLRSLRAKIQVVFQDPSESLNPRHNVGQLLEEPLLIHKRELDRGKRRLKIISALEMVGLSEAYLQRYSFELSGGQAQRVAIARALVLDPGVLVCDEPVASLDVAVQAQILNLLMHLQSNLNLSLILVAHDLAVIRRLSKRIVVMHKSRIVEIADNYELYANALHPYTKLLLSSSPKFGKKITRERIKKPKQGGKDEACSFYSRCPQSDEKCLLVKPSLRPKDEKSSHLVACHHFKL